MLVASRGSLVQVFSDLHRGSDFGPPLLHLLAWLIRNITGAISPVSMRVLSFLCVLAALAFVFFALRRRFDRMPSLIGALAVGSHSLVVTHAFEGRWYSLWLLFASLLAWALSLDADRPVSRRRDVTIAVVSILLCTTHWFGVLTLGLMSVAALATYGRDWRSGLRRVIPGAAGVVVLAMCAPLLFGQRGSITEKSWIPDLTGAQVWGMIRMFWLASVPTVAVLAILIAFLRERVKDTVRLHIVTLVRDPSFAALLVTAAMPLVLAVISLQQPAMLPRYAITSLLAWAPLIAIAAQSLGRVMRGAFILVLAALTWVSVLRVGVEQRNFALAVMAAQQALSQACTMNMPVLFTTRHLLYPSTHGHNGSCDARYLAISNATLDRMYPPSSSMPRFFRLENAFSVLHNRIYGYPKVAPQTQLDSIPGFLLVGWDASLPAGYKNLDAFATAVFPGHRVTRLTENLSLFQRQAPTSKFLPDSTD